MKIYGTAKGAALSTKDFGVAFGGAPATTPPDYEADMQSDPSWTVSADATNNFYDSTNKNFQWLLSYSNGTVISKDISSYISGSELQTKWVMRMTINPTDFGVYDSICFAGIADDTVAMNNGNFCGINWLAAYDRIVEIDSGTYTHAQNVWDSSYYLTDNEGTDYFLEIVRDESTITRSYYTNDTYSTTYDNCDTGSACTKSDTLGGSFSNGLKYFYMNHPAYVGWSSSAYTQGVIKNLKLWDGITSP